MAKPHAPDEESSEESVAIPSTTAKARITRVEESIDLVAPQDCCASVLLKLVDRVGNQEGPGDLIFAWWMVAGRYGILDVTARYEESNGYTVRIDVPNGVLLSTEYLLEQLKLHWYSLPDLPPDTPIIKGGQ